MNAAEQWTTALAAWAIPPEILAAAPESPWGFPTAVFERKADAVLTIETPSIRSAREVLPEAGTVLDVGCGAGLAAEALAKLGHRVTGIDAAAEAIAAADAHAAGQRLALTYRVATAEALLEEGARFEVITALEVIEHVPDPPGFIAVLARLRTWSRNFALIIENADSTLLRLW